MKSLFGFVPVWSASGDRSCDQGGDADADQSGDEIKWIEVAIRQEQLRGFVGAGYSDHDQCGGRRKTTAAGEVGEQRQQAE